MPAPAGTIAVEATSSDYFTLKHMPGGLPLDAAGKAQWPADQFTFRLIAEGALREQAPAAATTPPASLAPTSGSAMSDKPGARASGAKF